MMEGRFQDGAIMVIGAGTGIGAATVARLCAEGARVCIADINIVAADAVAKRMTDAGHNAFAVAIDIVDEVSVNAAFGSAVEQLGSIDGVHVNAADLRAIMADGDAMSLDL